MAAIKKAPPPYQHKDWPAWRYGPAGEAEIFNSPGEVPEGWTDQSPKAVKADAVKPQKVAPRPAPVAPKATAPAAPVAPKAAAKSKKADAPKEAPKAADFDRAAAIATLNAAGFDVEEGTTDDELKKALKDLETE